METKTQTIEERLYNLPLPKTKESQPKRFAGEPKIDSLNEDQRQALESITTNCIDGLNPMHLLLGVAGTGKTFLTSVLIEVILSKGKSIAISAPTNKAVKVIEDACPIKDTRITFNTIHSLLGLREKIDGYGNQTFVQISKEHSKLGNYNVLIVDETSMLDDSLFELINNYTSNGLGNLKVIFIGDPCQIPPVSKKDCIPFLPNGQIEFNIGVSKLLKVVRQAETNPLIAMSMKVRENLNRPNPVPVKEDLVHEETMDGVFFLDMNKKDLFYGLVDIYFNSENYKENSDFVKILCWRNKTVKAFNSIVRNNIYGQQKDKICHGERLIVNKPIIDPNNENSTLFTTNDEITILSYEVKEITIRELDITYYDAVAYLNHDKNIQQTIRIVHEKSEELIKEYVEYLSALAKREKQGTYQAAERWKDFYKFQELFADVNYAYAISCHKSQGSTYDNAFVLDLDLEANHNLVERNRIKYTAYTRPRHKLFIVY